MNTYLFRSNLPTKNGAFLWNEIAEMMAQRAAELNVSFPNNTNGEPFQIYDVNLLFPWETARLNAEIDFFYSNPEKGTFVSWPIFGAQDDPNALNETERRDLISNYTKVQNDSLPERIPYLHNLVHPDFPAEVPTAYLFHCSQGADRTGQVAASYVITYMNKTLQEAYEWDQEVAGRDITLVNQYGLKQYCWWLTYVKGYTHLECEGFKNHTMAAAETNAPFTFLQ